MSQPNPWSLFGLDLSRLADYWTMGCQQLLWSEQAGLRAKWYPPAKLVDARGGESVTSEFVGAPGHAQPANTAFEIPEDLVLVRKLRVPAVAEAEIANAVELEVESNSPFPPQDLCTGWRIESRDEESVSVAVVMTSRAAVSAWLRSHRDAVFEAGSSEVWASVGANGYVILNGFGEGGRESLYVARLKAIALKFSSLMLLVVTALTLPVAYTAIRAEQVEGELVRLKSESAVAAKAWERLLEQDAFKADLVSMHGERVPYRYWINKIAEISADDVFYSRLEFDQRTVEASGLAVNAAEYLGVLADSGTFEDLTSTSAFTRDRGSGLERFNIKMVLPAERAQ